MTCLKVPIVEQLHTLEASVGAKTHGFQTQKNPQKVENVWVLTQYNPIVIPNVCPVKIRSKHSSNTLLCLLRIFTGQTLGICIVENVEILYNTG
jgi:hypothetical protein